MASGVVNPDFYADFGALASLGKQAKQNDPQAIREAARQFESLFTDMMLKSMRAAKLGDGLGDSQESDFYQEMYDQQIALQMSQGKGLGLADMLVQQLTRRGALGQPGGAQGVAGAQGLAGAQGVAGAPAQARVSTGPGASPRPDAPAAAPPSAQAPAHAGASLGQRIGFVQKIAPFAQRAAAALGVSADTLIAQAALETGWGRHLVQGAAGASSNNLFGVKAGGSWQGTTASATTTEYSGSRARRVAQAFRSYGSVQQGVSDYVSLLQQRAAYAGALGSGSDVRAFAGALQRGGYATDPDYVHKLVATTAAVRSLRPELAAAAIGAAAPGAAAASAGGPLKVAADVPIQDGGQPA